MAYPQCSFGNLAQIFQLTIILVSFVFSASTMLMIILQKLYMNSFTFLILIIQSCYAVMATIDLLTKAAALSQNVARIWCQIVGPFIYGAIFSSFVLMQLFVVMIYRTISKKQYGWINRNVKQITLAIVICSVLLNCIGIPFYAPGFCNSCGFQQKQKSGYQIFVQIIIGFDYYFPIVLVIPTFYLIINLMCRKSKGQFDDKQTPTFKILLIPILNFALLIVSSISSYLNMKSGIAYVFIFDSVYFVSIINFIFYRCFTSFFEFGNNTQVKLKCCDFDCLKKKSQSERDQIMMYPYISRQSRN